MATTTRKTKTASTKTASAGKPGRKPPTTYQRNLRSRRNYQREREAARVDYQRQAREFEVQSHSQRLRQTSREQYRRQAIGAATSTVTHSPKLPSGGGRTGSIVMLYFVGGLVLILAYVAFRNPTGFSGMLNTFTGFLTHFASEQPLFQAQGGNVPGSAQHYPTINPNHGHPIVLGGH